uniref:G-protein coupled receptors family 1 profile domain-containing protein n=1 Tax=Oryzias sinensis TaxID=183150 RepID=A0A8C7XM54_9TELE
MIAFRCPSPAPSGTMSSFTFTLDSDYFENDTDLPDLNTQPCLLVSLGPAVSLVLSVLLVATSALAIPGNLLVGWVIGTNQRALTPSDVYLFHLTAADGLLALTLPFFAVAFVRGWIFGDFLCKFLNLIMEANFYTSIIFLACISVDRYLAIVHTRGLQQSRRGSCSRLLCAVVWAVGWALALPALFNTTIAVTLKDGSETWLCTESFHVGRPTAWRLATRVLRHVFGFVLPLVVMVACYGVTVAKLLHTRGFQKHRAMRVIMAVVVAFLLCWTPYHITLMVDTLLRAELMAPGCGVRGAVNVALGVTNSLALLHSCINPFLYAFVGRKFRTKMNLLLQRKFRRDKMSASRVSRSTSQTSEGAGTVL